MQCVWIDPVKLASYGCTVAEVRAALNQQNVELPSGKLTGNNTELTVKQLVIWQQPKNLITLS
jgi:HAE1 family hydrophobic/amphiphilic exporter-1/multidrug efflux pump